MQTNPATESPAADRAIRTGYLLSPVLLCSQSGDPESATLIEAGEHASFDADLSELYVDVYQTWFLAPGFDAADMLGDAADVEMAVAA